MTFSNATIDLNKPTLQIYAKWIKKQSLPQIKPPKRIINIYTATALTEDHINRMQNAINKHIHTDNPPSDDFKTEILKTHYKLIDSFPDLNLYRIHCRYCAHQILIQTQPSHLPQLHHCLDHLQRHINELNH